jgi:4-amino-4-deoxy-L-arabinose transferase-like glycosyltransferase
MPVARDGGPIPANEAQERTRTIALVLLLVASFALNAWGLGWGMPSPSGWAPDELRPSTVLDGMRCGFAGGWYDKYPPLHFYLLSALYLPVLKFEGLRAGTPIPPAVYERLFLIGRSLSLLMAAGTLLLVYRCGRELGDRRAGLFAAAITALTPPFVFYAKLANLDAPYLFWWALSLLFLLKAQRSRRVRDLLLFAATATLTVTTKDQAYGLYVLAAPLLLVARARARRETGPRAETGAVTHFLAEASWAVGVALALFALIYRLPGNADGLRAHVALITGAASRDFQEFPNDAFGHLRLLASTVRHLAFTLGLPAFLAMVLALAELVRESFRERAGADTGTGARDATQRWLLLLVPAVSFYLFFLSVVLYVYDRFALPLAIVGALLAGRGFSRHCDAPGGRGVAVRAAAVVLLAFGLTRAVGVDLAMANDARYAAEDWLRASAGDALVGAIGPAEYLPRTDGLRARPVGPAVARLEAVRPDLVVVNADYGARADEGTAEQRLYLGLDHGTLGYREAWRYRYHAPWPFLDTATLVERTGHEPLRSNLGKVNPEIRIYRRESFIEPPP